MTQVAAICAALLRGEVLSIMTGFKQFACSNLPRELSRSVEQKFNVRVSRIKKVFVSQYGQPGFYYQYRLNKDAPENQEGIKLMREYVAEQTGSMPEKLSNKTVVRQHTRNTSQKQEPINTNKLF